MTNDIPHDKGLNSIQGHTLVKNHLPVKTAARNSGSRDSCIGISTEIKSMPVCKEPAEDPISENNLTAIRWPTN